MKKIILTLLVILVAQTFVCAQTNDDVAQSINKIKLDTMYIYEEFTSKELNEAYDVASEILETDVLKWVKSQHPNESLEACVIKAKNHFMQLETRRGDYFRVFVYVRKDDILPIAYKKEVKVIDVTPVVQEKSIITVPVENTKQASNSNELTVIEKDLLGIANLKEINIYLKGQKENNREVSFGNYTKQPIEGDCYLLVFSLIDENNPVRAVLHRIGGVQQNLASMSEDNYTNYDKCGIIWIKYK